MGFYISASDVKLQEVDNFVSEQFDGFSLSLFGVDEGYFEWAFEASDAAGNVIGIIRGESYFQGLIIEHLCVSPECRRRGVGSLLLELALQLGRTQGLLIARLTTFEYQAVEFYVRHGFKIDFSRTSGFTPVAGALHYCSRLFPPDDVAALSGASPLPTEDGPSLQYSTSKCASIAVRRTPKAEHAAVRDRVLALLKAYAIETTGGSWARVQPFCFLARGRTEGSDSPGGILGVVSGLTFWGGVEVELLIIDQNSRKSGLGTALLARAESHARSSGAGVVCLQTFNFQVRRRC